MGCGGLVYWQRMDCTSSSVTSLCPYHRTYGTKTGSSPPHNLRKARGKDSLPLRRRQRRHHRYRLGPLPRNQPTHPRGNESRLRRRLYLELGR